MHGKSLTLFGGQGRALWTAFKGVLYRHWLTPESNRTWTKGAQDHES